MAENEKITLESGNPTIEESNTGENGIEAIIEKQEWQLWDSLNQPIKQEKVETVDDQTDFVELYEQQLKARDLINEYYTENKIKHPSWHINSVKAQEIRVYSDETSWEKLIKTNSPFDYCHLFIEKGWSIEEIAFSDKIRENEKIHLIYEVWKYLCIEVVDQTKKTSKYYYINKKGQYIPELWDQTWEYTLCENRFGGYQYEKEISKGKKSCIIYNKNMQKIASFEDGDKWTYRVTYCDDNICVCSLENNWTKSYVVFKEGNIIHEWELKDIEKDLEWINYMKNYFDYQNEKKVTLKHDLEEYKQRNSLPLEERYKDINNCEIIYNNDENSDISIINNEGKTLYQFWDIEERKYSNENTPTFYRNNWKEIIEIKNRKTDNNMLFIQINNRDENTTQSIFINKKTWDINKFNWVEWRYSFMEGKLIKIYHNEKEDATVYDDNFNCLWVIHNEGSEDHNDWYYVVKEEKKGWESDSNYYIVSIKEWKKLSKCYPVDWNWRFYADRYVKNWKTYLVVYSWNWKTQVEIEKP